MDRPGSAPDRARDSALRGELDALTCVVRFVQNDPAAALVAGRRALERLPVARRQFRASVLRYVGLATLIVEGPAIAVQRLKGLLAEAGDTEDLANLSSLHTIGLVHLAAGALQEAYETAERIVRLAVARRAAWVSGFVYLLLGAIAYEWDELGAAAVHFRTLAHESPWRGFRARRDGALGLALVYAAQGRVEEAWEEVNELAGQIVRTGNDDQLPPVRSFQARLSLLFGDVAQARECVRTVPVPNGINYEWLIGDPALTHARLLLAEATPDGRRQARAYLDMLHASAVAQHLTRQEIEILALQALVAAAGGDREGALGALERALVLAAPGGFVRTFVDLGAPLAPLLQEVARRRPDDPYPRRLLAAFAGAPTASPGVRWPGAGSTPIPPIPPIPSIPSIPALKALPGIAAAPSDGDVPGRGRAAGDSAGTPLDRLTYREEEVLICLAQRLTNKEIARKLGISPATVKRHVGNIGAKLGVDSRREAARLAKTWGLPTPQA
jgi:LuxR family maltose regulon positive regulatory protein